MRLADLHDIAKPLGFALVGVTDAAPTDHADHVRQWLTAGRHGEMAYLANHLDKRLDPRQLLPGAKSVICVADVYAGPTTQRPNDGDAQGRIARYAWGDDYHKVIKKRLHQLVDALREKTHDHGGHDAQFKVAVDTAPILEREHAQRAGLGWVGKHTLLIHPRIGSYMLIGEIITTLAIESAENARYPLPLMPGDDHCGTCTRCIDACPTDCISADGYQLDATRCISYLTLEHRSLIDSQMHEAMGDWIAGCDVCQEVCPHNDKPAHNPTSHLAADIRPEYTPRSPAPGIPLLDVLNWSADDRQHAFTRSALKRIKLDMLKRNALIAAGNYLRDHGDPDLRHRIEQLADDETEQDLVRQTAQQVLATHARL